MIRTSSRETYRVRANKHIVVRECSEQPHLTLTPREQPSKTLIYTARVRHFTPFSGAVSSGRGLCRVAARRAADALDDIEVGHHRHVLVLEVVAVEDVAPAIAGEPRDDLGFLVGPQVDGVLPAGVVGSWRPPGAGKDLEVREVQVDGVVRVRDQAPDLGRAQLRPRIGPVCLECLAVDGPYGPGPGPGPGTVVGGSAIGDPYSHRVRRYSLPTSL